MGEQFSPTRCLGPAVQGARLVFVGDAGRVDDLVPYAAGADLLAIEADLHQRGTRGRGGFRSPDRVPGGLAGTRGRRKYLVLHHISRRYSGRQILEEAVRIFPDTAVAKDFDLFRVVKHKPVEREDVRQRGEDESSPA